MENLEPFAPSKPRSCCVSGCKNRVSKRHRFPKRNPDVFKAWVERIKPFNFEELTTEEIYSRYVVCEEHFSPADIVPGRRGLKVTAIPSMCIPGFEDVASLNENEISVPVKRLKISEGPAIKPYQPKDIAAAGTSWQDDFLVPESSLNYRQMDSVDYASTSMLEHASIPGPSSDNGCCSSDVYKERPARTPPKVIAVKQGVRHRFSLLSKVNVTRAADLTPKAKTFYNTLKKWSVSMAYKESKIQSYQERLAHAENVIRTPNYTNLLKHVNNPTYNFIMCQVRNQKLKARARRYTLEEKILALSIYKSSGKGYRLLHKIFSLPSIKTLNALLQKIPMKPGINKHIFDSLKNHVENMKDKREKTCILLFDEMEISSLLKYDRKGDEILGFQDNGDTKQSLIADHANVFMIKGVFRQWKQPVVFSFSSGPIKSITLKTMIQSVIKECISIGLDVIATVCDQGATNQAAINMLLKETRETFIRKNEENPYFGFIVENREIIPLYDIPHLFKGIRNNLLNKNLHFELNGIRRVAKWAHIEQFYKLDISEPTLRLCHKLTDAHIYPSKIKKMKVKNCTQVFSHTVGSLMKRISKWDIQDNFNLPPEAEDTAELILFLDSLFDSVNVSKYTKVQAAKPLKCPVTKDTKHRDFWFEARKVIESMKFFSLEKKSFVSIPSIKNLNFTLRGFDYLTNNLLTEKKFKFVLTGAFNQDSLENFFSYIRSHGVRNTNPDPAHFIGSFKSLVANNYMATHSPGSNCQKDNQIEGLDNLRSFLTGEIVAGITPFEDTEKKNVEIPKEVVLLKKSRIGRCTIMYMSGAIIKMIMKSKLIKNCNLCKINLTKRHSSQPYKDDEVIEARQYEKGNLIRPGDFLNFLINNSLNYLFFLIPRMCTTRNISKVLHNIINTKLEFKTINCPTHNLGQKLSSLIVRCSLFWWSKSVNKILKGTDTKFSAFLSINKNKGLIDPIKQEALKKWEKKRKNSKRYAQK